MMPVAKDAMQLASDQMEEVQEYLNLEDLLRLLKKLVRHGPQFEMLVDQLDSRDRLLDVGPPDRRAKVWIRPPPWRANWSRKAISPLPAAACA